MAMKVSKEKSRLPILAAGGIVFRGHGPAPQIALVQSRKLGTWGLPKGKLAGGEDAVAAARREVLEETGCRVTIHEFLGTLAYQTGGRQKIVQFWRMEALDGPPAPLMPDVVAVRWLALDDAIRQLTRVRERVFLAEAGPAALRSARPAPPAVPESDDVFVPAVPLAPTDGAGAERRFEAERSPPDAAAGPAIQHRPPTTR